MRVRLKDLEAARLDMSALYAEHDAAPTQASDRARLAVSRFASKIIDQEGVPHTRRATHELAQRLIWTSVALGIAIGRRQESRAGSRHD